MKEEIKTEIENTTGELTGLISSVNEEQFNEIPFEGSWSVAQVCEHLLKSYGLADALKPGPVRQAERLPGKEIELIKKIFLDFNSKYISAETLLPTDEPIEKEKLLKALQKRIAQIEEVIQTKNLTEICVGIPFKGIGELTRLEWLYVILYHTQRHIRQAKSIEKLLNSQIA